MSNSCPRIFLSLLLVVTTPYSFYAQTYLADTLRQDTSLQDAAIIAIRSALGARDQTVVVRRNTFTIEIGMYIETYRGTRNANTLENIQNRYTTAKAELLEPRLPETIEELILALEKF